MSMRAEYTLKQAVAMVNWLAEEWCVHAGRHPFRKDEPYCQHCNSEMCWEISGDAEWCPVGWQIQHARAKWKRRCRYAAIRENVKITI